MNRAALDDVPLVEIVDDALPSLLAGGLVLGEDDHALLILDVVHEHLDLIADFERLGLGKLQAVDRPLGLKPDVHDDFLEGQRHDAALDDLALCDAAHAALVQIRERVGGGVRGCGRHWLLFIHE